MSKKCSILSEHGEAERIEQKGNSHEQTKMFNEQMEAHLANVKLVIDHVTL